MTFERSAEVDRTWDATLASTIEPAFPYDDCDEVLWYAGSALSAHRHYAPWSEMRQHASLSTWACHQGHTVASWYSADYPEIPSEEL